MQAKPHILSAFLLSTGCKGFLIPVDSVTPVLLGTLRHDLPTQLDWPTYCTQEPQMICPLHAAKLPSKGVLLPSLGSQELGLPPI